MTVNMTPTTIVCGQCGEGNFITRPGPDVQVSNALLICTVCHVEVRTLDLDLEDNDLVFFKPVQGRDGNGNIHEALMVVVLALVIENQDIWEMIDSTETTETPNDA